MTLSATLTLPDATMETIAERAAEIALTKLSEETSSPWMSVATASTWLDWPRERIYKLTAAHAIPHRRHQGRILLHRDELTAWLEEHREGPSSKPTRPSRPSSSSCLE